MISIIASIISMSIIIITIPAKKSSTNFMLYPFAVLFKDVLQTLLGVVSTDGLPSCKGTKP